MRKADGRHNGRLSISWRDVISHSPRGTPCFEPTVLVRRTTAKRVVRDDASSPADGGNPPWSLAVSQAANPDQNYRTGFPRDSTSSTISRYLRPAPRRESSPRTGLSP